MANNTIHAGRIHGSPLNGLCERICIEVPKVFDGCVSRFNNQTFVLDVCSVSADAIPPFTFLSAFSSGEANFDDLIVAPAEGCCSRIIGDVVIPLTVTFRDSTGRTFSGASCIRVHRDILLRLPREKTLIPFEIRTAASFIGNTGNFFSPTQVSVTGCYVIVNKVVVMADVLVPTYGYCVYPECTSCTDACNELLNLPLFPPGTR